MYLDEDPLVVADRLVPLVQQRWRTGEVRRPFAGPLRTMIEWVAWRQER